VGRDVKFGRDPDDTDDRVGFVLAAQTVEAGFWIDEQDVPDHVDAESDLPIRL
jgi:hypothetical protein